MSNVNPDRARISARRAHIVTLDEPLDLTVNPRNIRYQHDIPENFEHQSMQNVSQNLNDSMPTILDTTFNIRNYQTPVSSHTSRQEQFCISPLINEQNLFDNTYAMHRTENIYPRSSTTRMPHNRSFDHDTHNENQLQLRPIQEIRPATHHNLDLADAINVRYSQIPANIAENTSHQARSYNRNSYQPQVKDIIPLLIDYDPAKTSLKSFVSSVDKVVQMYNPHELVLLHAVTLKLKNNAKDWFESVENSFQDWNSMKTALTEEFSDSRDSVDVHRELERKKCSYNENVVDYAYAMRRIASEANVPEKDVVKYIITGLHNANLIYSLSVMRITTFSELMIRLRAHNSLSTNRLESNRNNPHRIDRSNTNRTNRNNAQADRNYSHRDHPYQKETRVCSYCKKPGHNESNCYSKNSNSSNTANQNRPNANYYNNSNAKNVSCVTTSNNEYVKTIELNGTAVIAFVDLGSECTVLSENMAKTIFTQYDECNQKLRGFGNGMSKAIGKVVGKIVIDGILLTGCEILIVRDLIQPANLIIGQNILNREDIIVVKGFNYFKLMTIPEKRNNIDDIQQMLGRGDSFDTEMTDVAVVTIDDDENDFANIMNGTINEDIDQNTRAQLITLFKEYRDCFACNMSELGMTSKMEIEIQLKDDKPVCYQPYRLSYAQREIVREHINEMLQFNIISPSTSPYSSPIVLVKKKNGENRICVDYRKLNNKTVKDHYPLPNMDDQIQRMAGKTYFTAVDLASGYYQIPVAETSRTKTAFVTPDGKYQFNRMPFGLVNAPSAFQRMMNCLTNELQNKIITYLDDIVIASSTIEQGIILLKEFMEKLREYGLTMKPSKCKFLQTKIEFLGHEISSEGMKAGKEKILCVEKFEIPTNVHEVRRFNGLANHFRKFVPKFAEIARPLTDLTRKHMAFVWGEDQNNAFNQLKSQLCSRNLLALYDPEMQHEVHTDASAVGIAGVLMQINNNGEKRPVAYFSRKTNSLEINYHSYELETLAVVESVERFRVYVLGKPFVVITDCASIKTSVTKKNLIPRVARWWLRLQEFDFEVKHRNGPQMVHVDALSRAPVLDSSEMEEASLDVFSIGDENKWLISLQKTDENVLSMKNKILEKDPHMNNFIVYDDCVYFKNENGDKLFVIPKSLRSRVVLEAHSSGHFGLEKTLEILKRNFWFAKMRPYVKQHILSCVECLYQKDKSGAKGIELHPIEKIPIPQHTWHIDHLGPFVKSSRKNSYIIVFTDAFTKYVHFRPAKDTSTKFVIKAIDDIIIHFGTPTRIITDRGTAFTSNTFERYCKDLNISHILNATATPRANGQVERTNRTLLNSVRTLIEQNNEQNWESKLRQIQWTINTTTNSVTKKSPHELLFGYIPKSIFKDKLTLQMQDDKVVEQRENYVEQTIENREEALKNIEKHQKYSKQYFDAKHKKPDEYAVGDLVMVQRETVSTGTSTKLQQRYRGPYQIIEKLHGDRYRITDIAPIGTKRKFTGVFPAEKLKFVDRPAASSSDESHEENTQD